MKSTPRIQQSVKLVRTQRKLSGSSSHREVNSTADCTTLFNVHLPWWSSPQAPCSCTFTCCLQTSGPEGNSTLEPKSCGAHCLPPGVPTQMATGSHAARPAWNPLTPTEPQQGPVTTCDYQGQQVPLPPYATAATPSFLPRVTTTPNGP